MNEWKRADGWKLDELMKVVTSLNERESSLLREMIRQYGIRTPEELLFFPPMHYQRIRQAGKLFFLNVKKALYENGIPYDRETLDMINQRIEDGRDRQAAYIKLRFEILKRDNFTCQYCGRSPKTERGVVLVMDHKHPASKGGDWSMENLITSCRECNAGKSDILLQEIDKTS